MKRRILLACSLVFALSPLAQAASVADLARAQLLFAKVMNYTQKYKQAAGAVAAANAPAVEVKAPTPCTDRTGKFCVPYDENGQLTPWANKAIGAQIGAAIGAKAGEKVGSMALSHVPFGGMFAGAAKKKGKELGALIAVGGADFVKQTSPYSFNDLNEYAVYLHLTYSGDPDYVKALGAALAIYPDLEKTYETALQRAYGG